MRWLLWKLGWRHEDGSKHTWFYPGVVLGIRSRCVMCDTCGAMRPR